MRRVAIFIGGVAVGLGLAVAILSPWKAATAQGDRIYTKPGDVDGDGSLTIGDAVFLLNFLFASGPEPAACPPGGGMLPAPGQRHCYDGVGNIIFCASADYPGQDGFYGAGCPNEGRFVDNGDGTVTDTCTGLIWQKDTADVNGDGQITWEGDALTWQDTLKYCDALVFAGRDDWRLPNIRELLSIVDYGRDNPAIDPVFGALSEWSWSSSTLAVGPVSAWGVDFWIGKGDFVAKAARGCVRAVRGGLSR
ncbi:MAG: DUF1566 domain-containing protein, partial [Planctomycetes bacterium]|nr:DUF1566 domain-containing protein [Planctomycetota bacterium]